MKLKITKNMDYRVSPAVIQAFRAGTDVEVPKKTADALIKAGAATPLTADKQE